jgi:glucokinase
MTGMAGELGHIIIDPEGPPCGCGARGCLEQFASATAVKRMALEAISAGKAPELARAMSQDPEFSAKVIHQMATQGDEPARAIFRRIGSALGLALASLVNIFNLPMYVIGGGVSSAWDAFAPSLFDELRRFSYVYNVTARQERPYAEGSGDETRGRRSTIVTRALLGSDAGLLGAARLPMITSVDLAQHSTDHVRSAK